MIIIIHVVPKNFTEPPVQWEPPSNWKLVRPLRGFRRPVCGSRLRQWQQSLLARSVVEGRVEQGRVAPALDSFVTEVLNDVGRNVVCTHFVVGSKHGFSFFLRGFDPFGAFGAVGGLHAFRQAARPALTKARITLRCSANSGGGFTPRSTSFATASNPRCLSC